MLNNIIAPKQQRVDFPNLISKRAPNCLTVINAADSSYHLRNLRVCIRPCDGIVSYSVRYVPYQGNE